MNKKDRRKQIAESVQAPGIDPDDSFGRDATKEEIEQSESTKVTRLTYDEYDLSER